MVEIICSLGYSLVTLSTMFLQTGYGFIMVNNTIQITIIYPQILDPLCIPLINLKLPAIQWTLHGQPTL
jgi:hypothetical protein